MPTDPGTRSPGFLTLVYSHAGDNHEASVRFITGVDLNDVSAIRTDATNLAAAVRAVFPGSCTINAWRIKDPNHVRLYEEAFAPTLAGTHAAAGTDWRSITYTVTGKGVATGVTVASGQTRFELFTGNFKQPAAGDKFILASADTALAALVSLFHTNLRYFADYFGQHAEPRSAVTIQFNAAVQRRKGA
jgi:hypothetical protein